MNNQGRVGILDNTAQKAFELSPESQEVNFQTDALRGVIQKTPLSETYFSADNVNLLQDSIRYLVYQQSCNKHVIDRQSDEQLMIVMRSIYLQNANHQPFNIKEQVQTLNRMVLEFCVPKILGEIEAYLGYRSEISTNPDPIARSTNVNIKGTKTLEIKNL
jgi:hypothetical protein